MTRVTAAALLCAVIPTVAACERAEPEKEGPAVESAGGETRTLAAAIVTAPSLSTFAGALKDTDLAGALDGAAPYTLLAPTDTAFSRLGPAAAELRKPEQRAAAAAIIREHTIPGYLTPRDIRASIAAHSGEPVRMRTAGSGAITFALEGEALLLTSNDGITARIAGETLRASNGAAIPIDTVLKTLAPAEPRPSPSPPPANAAPRESR